jgi:hypothetical protein
VEIPISFFDDVHDRTGLYQKEDKTPFEYNGHWSWIYVYNNECISTIDDRQISPGATRIGVKGHWNGSALAFKNPNGEIVIVVSNAVNLPRIFNFKGQNQDFSVELKPNLFNTFVINK